MNYIYIYICIYIIINSLIIYIYIYIYIYMNKINIILEICRVFGSVVASAFQITFRAKMHANDFFHFLKIIFDISTSKRSKTYKSY